MMALQGSVKVLCMANLQHKFDADVMVEAFLRRAHSRSAWAVTREIMRRSRPQQGKKGKAEHISSTAINDNGISSLYLPPSTSFYLLLWFSSSVLLLGSGLGEPFLVVSGSRSLDKFFFSCFLPRVAPIKLFHSPRRIRKINSVGKLGVRRKEFKGPGQPSTSERRAGMEAKGK